MLWYATKQADKAYRGEYKIGKNMDKSNRVHGSKQKGIMLCLMKTMTLSV